jgi:hypothetical protein
MMMAPTERTLGNAAPVFVGQRKPPSPAPVTSDDDDDDEDDEEEEEEPQPVHITQTKKAAKKPMPAAAAEEPRASKPTRRPTTKKVFAGVQGAPAIFKKAAVNNQKTKDGIERAGKKPKVGVADELVITLVDEQGKETVDKVGIILRPDIGKMAAVYPTDLVRLLADLEKDTIHAKPARDALKNLLDKEGNEHLQRVCVILPCSPPMLPSHAPLPCFPPMLPSHASLPCFPPMLPSHASLLQCCALLT